jgi:hypothetical protein
MCLGSFSFSIAHAQTDSLAEQIEKVILLKCFEEFVLKTPKFDEYGRLFALSFEEFSTRVSRTCWSNSPARDHANFRIARPGRRASALRRRASDEVVAPKKNLGT